jgi:uncharacterized delta-60 repeat protein
MSRRSLMEALERRVMLSITDPLQYAGYHGFLTPIPGLSEYQAFSAASGDVLVSGSGSTSNGPNEAPTDFAQIADVAGNGTINWTVTMDSPVADSTVGIVSAAELANGSAVVASDDRPGNGGYDYLTWINSDGSIASNQQVGISNPTYGGVGVIAPLPDGTVVAVFGEDGGQEFNLERFSSDGSVLTTYVGNAFITESGINRIYSIGVQSDGKIIVAGTGSTSYFGAAHLAVERFNTDGSLDTAFGDDGRYIASLKFAPMSMAIASNDEIFLAGGNEIAAITANGQLAANIDAHIPVVTDLKIADDGSLYVAGYTGSQPTLAQFTASGSLMAIFKGTSEFSDAVDAGFLATTPDSILFSLSSDGTVQEGVGFFAGPPIADSTPPNVALDPLRRINTGATTYDVDVLYVDAKSGVDFNTLQDGSVFLHYGRHKYIYGNEIYTFGDFRVAATYSFAAPSGSWLNDAGTYTIETAADEVTDNAGNGVPLEVLGSFTIKAEKSANAAAVVEMDMPMLEQTDSSPAPWLESDLTGILEM